jgi:hypothetical protein
VNGACGVLKVIYLINDRCMLHPFFDQTPDFLPIRFVKGDFMTYKSGPSSNDRSIPKVPLLPNCRTIPSKFNSTTLTGSLMASRIEQVQKQANKRSHSKSQEKDLKDIIR